MKPNESWARAAKAPEQIVVVDEGRYVELLLSRRRLDRVWDRPTRLIDLDTREVFVHRAEAEGRQLDLR